ncbi:MAG: PAS-domain containing protein, partial [Candidatus Omnitrophica bacterium]|nr:PAS-domain containing protein [Candidatus Omnitrophota bacterium]
MRKVSQADFSQRIISKSKDEIGRLTQIFNKMAQDLMTLMQKERKKTEELNRSLSLLSATLESTADGILAVDRQGKIVSFNHRFVQMWNIPAEILESRDDEQALRFVLEQVKSPADFLNKVKSLYGQPQLSSLDVIEFKDGRVFERYSQPQRLSDEIIGRVWSFHDVTERVAAGRKWQEQNIFLNNIIESLTHPFYVIDTNDYTVKMANTAARQKEVAENFFCYKLTHKSDRPCTGPEHICPL